MHARAPITASPKLVASELWQEPIADGSTKHRRFVWATQFSGGSSGDGATGYKTRPALKLARTLAERPNVNVVTRERQRLNRVRNTTPPKIIYPEKSEMPASWWRTAS